MKKLIKFLFPKTYLSIFDDAYNQAYNDYNNYGDDYHDEDYDPYGNELLQHDADIELERLHDEYYAQIAEEEYEAQLLKEYEEDCRLEQQELIKLYAPKAPELNVGDKIHLHSKQGMYTITEVYNDSFAYRTRDSIDDAYTNYDDYKCHAGGK